MSPDPPREYRFEAPGLQVPHDIDEAADEDRGDARARALLEANGVTTDPPSLEAALAGDTEVLRAAAARILGADDARGACPALEELAAGTGDTDRVEAAYALVRLGRRGPGVAALTAMLPLPVEAFLGASMAAGDLARIGDGAGWGTIDRALGSSNPIVRRVAARQLVHFAALDADRAAPLVHRAIADTDAEVVREAVLARLSLGAPE